MKTVKATTAAFWLDDCPYCGEDLENPGSGGYLFYRDDYHKPEDLIVHCDCCDNDSKLPETLLYPQ